MKAKLESIYFDLCDLLDGEQIDGIEIDVFGFKYLREVLEEHKAILEQVQEEIENV